MSEEPVGVSLAAGADESMAEPDAPLVASTSAAPMATPSVRRSTTIQATDLLLLSMADKTVRQWKMTPGQTIVNLGPKYGNFPASHLVGQPYGVTFEIVPRDPEEIQVEREEKAASEKLRQQEKQSLALDEELDEDDEAGSVQPSNKGKGRSLDVAFATGALRRVGPVSLEEIQATENTNEKILATGAKTLTHDEIMALKESGVSGKEIIERQIKEHEAFELKNEYSKAKYQRRKESKYLKYFTPLPTTVHNVCQYWFSTDSKRIRDLRPDTLSQIMSLGNIRPGSRVLVVDDSGGMLTGAALERMAGEGLVLIINANDSPPANPFLPMLNLPTDFLSIIKHMHWGHTDPSWTSADFPTEPADPSNPGEMNTKERQRMRKRKQAQEAIHATIGELHAGEFDAILISSAFDPLEVLKKLMPYLGGSAQIVMHSPSVHILTQAVQAMIPMPSVLNATLVEPFLRQYQVLPGRTHPEMNGTDHGGFLLHATRVLDDGRNYTPGRGVERASGAVGRSGKRSRRR